MKKSLKTMLISGIASLLTATIILISGGSAIVVAILGGAGICFIPSAFHLNNTEKNIKKKYHTEFTQNADYIKNTPNFTYNNEQLNLEEKEIDFATSEKIEFEDVKSITPTEKNENILEQYFLYELETTEATSQEESINRLVRKRKKETEERLTRNNIQ